MAFLLSYSSTSGAARICLRGGGQSPDRAHNLAPRAHQTSPLQKKTPDFPLFSRKGPKNIHFFEGPGGGGRTNTPFTPPPPHTLGYATDRATTFQTPDIIHNLSPSARVSQSLPPLQYSRTFTSHSGDGGSLYSHTYISLGAAFTPTHISLGAA